MNVIMGLFGVNRTRQNAEYEYLSILIFVRVGFSTLSLYLCFSCTVMSSLHLPHSDLYFNYAIVLLLVNEPGSVPH